MKFYCAECFEEIGNCLPWCGEAARERATVAQLEGAEPATHPQALPDGQERQEELALLRGELSEFAE